MAAHLPEISIVFQQKAQSFLRRSTRGVLFLIVREANPDAESSDPLTPYVTEITDDTVITGWTTANQQQIKDVQLINPYKFFVVTIDENGVVADATPLIEKTYPTGRVTMIGTATDYAALVTWAKSLKIYHVLTFNTASSNSRYVENVYSQNVVFADDNHGTGSQSSINILPLLGAMLCKANVRGVTYSVIPLIKSVENVGTPTAENTAINNGNLILRNDWEGTDRVVRVGTAVNTLTTFTDDEPEDFRYIEVAETADMIKEDIASTFRDSYVGKVKNTTNNQYLFISDILRYFDDLISEDIIDGGDNAPTVDIDVDAQRTAWATVDPDASGWDDDKVKQSPFKREVFLASTLRILQSMQDLTMTITLN